jgi:HNH endonuclease
MPEDIEGVDEPPLFFTCDPLTRQFPSAWKDVRFRRSARRCNDGMIRYECPICKTGFDHTNVDYLQGDHIWPYSLFGETSWANYQLICGSCNAKKRDFVDEAVRKVLGDGAFRGMVRDYLRNAAQEGRIIATEVVRFLLACGYASK